MRIGEQVEVDQMQGIVVANIDTGEFSAEYPAADWAYLKTGVLVKTLEAGLLYLSGVGDAVLPIQI